MLQKLIFNLLADPTIRHYRVDDPRLTDARRSIVREKKFLNSVYRDWYQQILQAIPSGSGQILELGSGAGFLKDLCPPVIHSEIFWCSNVQVVLDGCALPFPAHSLKAIVMTDVLHHIPQVRSFFAEASRCLVDGGTIAMVEPWITSWSRQVYRRLHHEPLDPDAARWEFASSGPLSGANSALPWIVFQRDREMFLSEFPQFSIEQIQVQMPFRYLVSGGVSMRSLAPAWSYGMWRSFVQVLSPWADRLGMFALVVLRKSR